MLFYPKANGCKTCHVWLKPLVLLSIIASFGEHQCSDLLQITGTPLWWASYLDIVTPSQCMMLPANVRVHPSYTQQFPHHLPCSFLIIYPAVSSSFTQLLPNIQPTFIHILPIHFTHHLPIIWRQESTCCRHFHHEGWSSTRQRCSGSSSTSDQEAQEIPHTRRLQKCSVVEMTNLHWFACHIIYIYIIYIYIIYIYIIYNIYI